MTVVVITVPWPPTVNHYWRRTERSRLAIGKAGLAYRAATRQLVGEYTDHFGRVTKRLIAAPMLGKLDVAIYAHPPDQRRRDLDNILKCLLDALQHAGVYRDDYQIDRILIERNPNGERGQCIVAIKEFAPAMP